MNDIKPIQTEYKGYKFRSRLEARWAVFFDACGVDWEYEPEGYDLGEGVYYLPDFLLHDVKLRHNSCADLYIEVKGQMNKEDRLKIQSFGKPFNRPLLVVGNIPFGDDAWTRANNAFEVWDKDSLFYSFELIDDDYFGAFPGIDEHGRFSLFGADSNYLNEMNSKKTEEAYKLAQQARFEHGESPVF